MASWRAGPDDEDVDGKGEEGEEEEGRGIWGTWEELVLACAVSRYGTGKWDSVAVEVASRATAPSASHLLTPRRCRRRYRELRRRYEGVGGGGGGAGGMDEGEEEDGDEDTTGAGCDVSLPWLEDLRRLRVAELRREVERYDVSIFSLQLKVKKLTEERERSLREGHSGAEEPDPDAICDGESAGSPLGTLAAAKDVEEEEDGRRNDHGDAQQPGREETGDEKGPGEGSCDGSSDTVAKEGDRMTTRAELVVEDSTAAASAVDPTAAAAGPAQRGESAEAATTAADVDKENSDVQSSAGQSRGRRGSRKPGSGVFAGAGTLSSSSPAVSSGIDEEVSRPHLLRGAGGSAGAAGSRTLASFLEIIRSHKYGSEFKSRLPAQETARYRSLIRQHMDLDSIQRRLDDHAYTRTEFLRDLLLLCANATVFFPRDSDEHAAGVALRALVTKELVGDRDHSSNRSTSSGPATTAAKPAPLGVVVPKQEAPAAAPPDLPSFLEKPGSSLVACRKRSAISSGKGAALNVEVQQKKPEGEEDDEEKKVDKPLRGVVVERPFKRGLRTTKARGAATKLVPPVTAALKAEEPEPAKTGDAEASSCSIPPAAPVVAKKRGAAGFLKRLKGATTSPSRSRSPSPTPSPSPADETPTPPPHLTDPPKGSKGGAAVVAEQKKGTTALKVTGKEKAAAVSMAMAKPPQEPDVQPKRKGRPPKRKAAPPPPPPSKKARTAAEPALPLARLRGGNRKRD